MRGINRVRAFATGAAPAYQIAAKVGGDTGMGDSREGHCGGGVDAQCGAALAFGSLRRERTARSLPGYQRSQTAWTCPHIAIISGRKVENCAAMRYN